VLVPPHAARTYHAPLLSATLMVYLEIVDPPLLGLVHEMTTLHVPCLMVRGSICSGVDLMSAVLTSEKGPQLQEFLALTMNLYTLDLLRFLKM